MEHRLILGGEQYLPFARSRIKALRATGLAYASQKFDMGDATVRVRIEPGHEYIEIEGGAGIDWECRPSDSGSSSGYAPDPLSETDKTKQVPIRTWGQNPYIKVSSVSGNIQEEADYVSGAAFWTDHKRAYLMFDVRRIGDKDVYSFACDGCRVSTMGGPYGIVIADSGGIAKGPDGGRWAIIVNSTGFYAVALKRGLLDKAVLPDAIRIGDAPEDCYKKWKFSPDGLSAIAIAGVGTYGTIIAAGQISHAAGETTTELSPTSSVTVTNNSSWDGKQRIKRLKVMVGTSADAPFTIDISEETRDNHVLRLTPKTAFSAVSSERPYLFKGFNINVQSTGYIVAEKNTNESEYTEVKTYSLASPTSIPALVSSVMTPAAPPNISILLKGMTVSYPYLASVIEGDENDEDPPIDADQDIEPAGGVGDITFVGHGHSRTVGFFGKVGRYNATYSMTITHLGEVRYYALTSSEPLPTVTHEEDGSKIVSTSKRLIGAYTAITAVIQRPAKPCTTGDELAAALQEWPGMELNSASSVVDAETMSYVSDILNSAQYPTYKAMVVDLATKDMTPRHITKNDPLEGAVFYSFPTVEQMMVGFSWAPPGSIFKKNKSGARYLLQPGYDYRQDAVIEWTATTSIAYNGRHIIDVGYTRKGVETFLELVGDDSQSMVFTRTVKVDSTDQDSAAVYHPESTRSIYGSNRYTLEIDGKFVTEHVAHANYTEKVVSREVAPGYVNEYFSYTAPESSIFVESFDIGPDVSTGGTDIRFGHVAFVKTSRNIVIPAHRDDFYANGVFGSHRVQVEKTTVDEKSSVFVRTDSGVVELEDSSDTTFVDLQWSNSNYLEQALSMAGGVGIKCSNPYIYAGAQFMTSDFTSNVSGYRPEAAARQFHEFQKVLPLSLRAPIDPTQDGLGCVQGSTGYMQVDWWPSPYPTPYEVAISDVGPMRDPNEVRFFVRAPSIWSVGKNKWLVTVAKGGQESQSVVDGWVSVSGKPKGLNKKMEYLSKKTPSLPTRFLQKG